MTGAQGNKRTIDPAALIVATLALLGSTLFASGPFSPLSSALGAIILVVIYAYDEDDNRGKPQKLAFALVTGFAWTVVLGSVAQCTGWLPVPKDCVEDALLQKLTTITLECYQEAGARSQEIQLKLILMWAICSWLALWWEFTRKNSNQEN